MLEHNPHRLEDELCFAIYTAQKNYNKFYAESLQEFKLTYPQYIVMLVLWEEKRPMMIKELGQRLGLDTGTLTPLLRRMEKDEWLTRTRDEKDGRKVFIALSQKGLDQERAIKESVSTCFSHINLTQTEYVNSVKRVNEIAEALAENNKRLAKENM